MPPYDAVAFPADYSRYGAYGPHYDQIDEPIDPRQYNGDVIGVEYFVRSADQKSGYPSYSYNADYSVYPTSALPYHDRGEVISVEYVRRGSQDRYVMDHPNPSYAEEVHGLSSHQLKYPREEYLGANVARNRTHDPVESPQNRIKSGRPWFGVGLKWIDSLQKENGKIAVVGEVLPGSPAAEAGILPGDFIGYWERDRLSDSSMWESKLASVQVGDVVTLGAQRNGQTFPVTVRFTAHP